MNVILIENHVYRQFEITLNNTNEVGNLKKPQSHMLCECILEHINHAVLLQRLLLRQLN